MKGNKELKSIEKLISAKTPTLILRILLETGFESEIALLQIDEKIVVEIEEYVNIKMSNFFICGARNQLTVALNKLFDFIDGVRV